MNETERLMAHPVPRPSHRRMRWPIKTTPPRCAACKKEPPVCECLKEAS